MVLSLAWSVLQAVLYAALVACSSGFGIRLLWQQRTFFFSEQILDFLICVVKSVLVFSCRQAKSFSRGFL